MLSGADCDPQLLEAYRILVTKVTISFVSNVNSNFSLSLPLSLSLSLSLSHSHSLSVSLSLCLSLSLSLSLKDSPTESVINWDIKRTYVGHEFFQEASGKEALYKISKAYSVYDTEVGYCQGFSFMAAVLLLQVMSIVCLSVGLFVLVNVCIHSLIYI